MDLSHLDCPHDSRHFLPSQRGLVDGLRTDIAEKTAAGLGVEHFQCNRRVWMRSSSSLIREQIAEPSSSGQACLKTSSVG
ncbi:Uncharacterised protein [Serratia plymuthica]|nr:Uncharacterised protein [Serratia plymuthica]